MTNDNNATASVGIRMAVAGQVDLLDGHRIWIPPTGRPYWVNMLPGRAGPDLSDGEIAAYLPPTI